MNSCTCWPSSSIDGIELTWLTVSIEKMKSARPKTPSTADAMPSTRREPDGGKRHERRNIAPPTAVTTQPPRMRNCIQFISLTRSEMPPPSAASSAAVGAARHASCPDWEPV